MSSSPRITATIDDLTIEEWINTFPTRPELSENAVKRTDEQKQADLDWHKALFEKVPNEKLCCMIIYLVQVLQARDPKGTHYLLSEMQEIIETEMMLDIIPPALRQFLQSVVNIREN